MSWIKLYIFYFLFSTIKHCSTRNQLNEQFVEITKSDIWSKLLRRSVYVGGNENISLSTAYLTRYFQENDENVIKMSEIFYITLKCHCADSIKYLHKTILVNESQESTPDYDPNGKRKHRKSKPVLSDTEKINVFLEELNNNLVLTVTILFELSDRFTNFKTQEPFFLKILLSINLFINQLKEHKSDDDCQPNKKMKSVMVDTADSHTYCDQNVFTSKKHPMGSVVTQRMILQIMNVIERFTIENCVETQNAKPSRLFAIHMDHLNELLRDIRHLSDTNVNIAREMYDVNRVMLNVCFDNDPGMYSTGGLIKLCNNYLAEASVDDMDRTPVFLKTMFVECRQAEETDRDVLYEFLESVFKVIEKIVYQTFKMAVDNDELRGRVDGDSTKSKLLTAHCPVELGSAFDVLTRLATGPETGAANKIIDDKLASLSDVNLPGLDGTNAAVSMEEIVECIVSVDFKQFWWVFNALRRANEKQSDYVYGVSFKTISDPMDQSDEHVGELQRQIGRKCASLKTIYLLSTYCFRLKLAVDEYRVSNTSHGKESTIEVLSKILSNNVQLSNHYSQVITTLSANYYLFYKDDFLNILLFVISNLENAYYTQFDCDDCVTERLHKNYFFHKTEKFKQLGDYIINVLDNYQIHNCKSINSNQSLLNEFQSNPIYQQNLTKGILLIEIPIVVPEKIKVYSYYFLPQIISNEPSTSPDEYNELFSTVRIPLTLYNINFLNHTVITSSHSLMHTLRSSIYFNCFGNVNNLYRHIISRPYQMINLHNYVEFQKIVFKWIFASFYFAWVIVFDSFILQNETVDYSNFDAILTDMTFYLRYFISIEFPEFCKTYLNTIKNVFNYYTLYHNTVSLITYNVLKTVIAVELDRLEVFYVERTYQGMKTEIIKNPSETLNVLTYGINECIHMLKENLIFVN